MEKILKRKEIIELIKDLSYYFDKYKDTLCEPYGLSSIQSKIVIDVYHNEGTRITGICYRLNKETNTISPLVSRLVKHGYLEKVNDKEDRRVFYVYLTERSKNIMKKFLQDVEEFAWPLFDKVTDEELDTIYRSLKILNNVTTKNDK